MPPSRPATSPALWIVIAAACLFFGTVLGYVLSSSHQGPAALSPAAAPPPAATTAPGTPQPSFVDERQLQAYRDILARDPRNAQAAIQMANLLYDAGRYAEAIPLYQQAHALEPQNVGVSTDLGTALWYTGQPDAAVAQYARSLAVDPSHAQTLFNLGIVKLEGQKDPKGALDAWERLLKANPSYPDRQKLEQLMAQARQQLPK